MIRRDFLKVMSSGVLAKLAFLDRTEAASQTGNNAKVMLFGVAVISGDQAGHKAVFPTIGKHASFLVGQRGTLSALAAGHQPIPATGSNIAEGHDDIGLAGEHLLCYPGPNLSIGTGESQISPGLSAHLPRLVEIADLMDPSQKHSIRTPAGSLEVTLRGGYLRTGTPSRNRGTHNIPWQFVGKDNREIGGRWRLTDLLVYHSQSAEMEIAVNGSRKALLGPGERLWIVNFPTYAVKDTTPLEIEHAHEWLSLVTPAVANAGEAKILARTSYNRGESKGLELNHPCAAGKVEARLRQEQNYTRYFPPDTDPCFIVMG